jgi:hypothetical protein
LGINKFVLQADPPNPELIPSKDLTGVTVVLVTCSYKDQEFARVGYYVINEYKPFDGYSEEIHGIPPEPLDVHNVVRTIVADKRRVTLFPICWSSQELMTQQQDKMCVEEEYENDSMDDDNCDLLDYEEKACKQYAGSHTNMTHIDIFKHASSPSKDQTMAHHAMVVSPDVTIRHPFGEHISIHR